jgi:hypothetical protein
MVGRNCCFFYDVFFFSSFLFSLFSSIIFYDSLLQHLNLLQHE